MEKRIFHILASCYDFERKTEMVVDHTSSKEEESLDPQNWDEMRQLAHRMVDDMMG